MRVAPSLWPQAGRSSSNSGRVGQRSRTGASSIDSRRWSIEVEERLLRPVDVLDDEHDRPVGREPLEEPSQRPEELLHRKRVARLADRGSKPVGDAFTRVVGERAELLTCLGGVVLVEDSRLGADRLGDRPESDAVPVGKAAPGEHGRAFARAREKLRREPRLADPGVTDHGRQAGGASGRRRVEGLEERLELGRPPDEAGAGPHRPVSGSADADEAIGRHGLRFPLQGERLDLLDLDVVADERVRECADEDLALPRRLLQPGGDVHGVTGDEPLAARRIARHDLSRVHAGAVGQLHPVHLLELGVQVLERGLHACSRSDGAKRVVLVEPWQPEDGHHGVADELLDHPAVPFELRPHRVEVPRHHLAQCLRVERLAEARRPLQVGEDDRHDLAMLLRRTGLGERAPAREAEPRNRGVLDAARPAGLHTTSVRARLDGALPARSSVDATLAPCPRRPNRICFGTRASWNGETTSSRPSSTS